MCTNKNYNYKNLDELLKEAAAILEKVQFKNLSNESFVDLLNKKYGNQDNALNDLKNIVQQIEFNQNDDKNLIFNIQNNMLIIERDAGNVQYWNNPTELTTEEVNEHFLYPGIEFSFKKDDRDIIYFNTINITNTYVPINEFTSEAESGIRGKKEVIRKTPVSFPN